MLRMALTRRFVLRLFVAVLAVLTLTSSRFVGLGGSSTQRKNIPEHFPLAARNFPEDFHKGQLITDTTIYEWAVGRFEIDRDNNVAVAYEVTRQDVGLSVNGVVDDTTEIRVRFFGPRELGNDVASLRALNNRRVFALAAIQSIPERMVGGRLVNARVVSIEVAELVTPNRQLLY